MAARLVVHAEMDDGQILEATCDQRDYAAWEIHPLHDDDRPVTRIRYLAFSALNRSGWTKLSWPAWNAACVSADAADSALVDVDPTRAGQPAAD
jgi:hypothetical protein